MACIPDIRKTISVEFEVFGTVQGCYFTKYTHDLCTKAGINGWVKNSKQGTIIGKMQGPEKEVEKMIQWLSEQGSPDSHIEKCELRNMVTLNRLDYKNFEIRF